MSPGIVVRASIAFALAALPAGMVLIPGEAASAQRGNRPSDRACATARALGRELAGCPRREADRPRPPRPPLVPREPRPAEGRYLTQGQLVDLLGSRIFCSFWTDARNQCFYLVRLGRVSGSEIDLIRDHVSAWSFESRHWRGVRLPFTPAFLVAQLTQTYRFSGTLACRTGSWRLGGLLVGTRGERLALSGALLAHYLSTPGPLELSQRRLPRICERFNHRFAGGNEYMNVEDARAGGSVGYSVVAQSAGIDGFPPAAPVRCNLTFTNCMAAPGRQ